MSDFYLEDCSPEVQKALMREYVIVDYGGKRPYVVLDKNGGIALGQYSYKGHLVPRRFKTEEAARKAMLKAREA